MKKVLIISYYWPPSGGAGVQRWLKLSKYLSKIGVDVYVLTIDPKSASFPSIDDSLEKDIESSVKVFKTKARNYFKLYETLVGKKNVPKAGYSNVNSEKSSQKVVSTLRSHLFIPDPRKGWNKYATSRAIELINEFGIENIITTSPPHSTQLIGLEVKKRLPQVNWIADLRDPWTDIYYYKLLGHSKFSRAKDKRLEKSVLENASILTTVSGGFKRMFLSKGLDIKPDDIKVITNGFDADDFSQLDVKTNDRFTVTYTGTMSEQYSPEMFFNAFKTLQEEYPEDCSLKIVGTISPAISSYIDQLELEFEFIRQVPHEEVVEYQNTAHILLLVIPDVVNSDGIIPGKLFEYLASRNRIIVLGEKDGDVAGIVEEANAGRTFSRPEEKELYSYMKSLLLKLKEEKLDKIPHENVSKYSRTFQAKEFKKLLK